MTNAATPLKHFQTKEKEKLNLSFVKKIIIYLWLTLFPLFFLPITQDFFNFNKLFLTIVAALFLVLLSLTEFIVNKKINLIYNKIATPLTLLFFSSILSIVVSSPNKIQALIYSNFTPVLFLSLSIISYYIVRLRIKVKPFVISTATLLALVTIVFFFNPFSKINLPDSLAFLKNPYFSPIGSYIDLLIYLGFALIWQFLSLKSSLSKKKVIYSLLSSLILIGFIVGAYNILKPQTINGQPFKIFLPPFRLSWYAAVEILKNPITAIFGVGADNYAAIFTNVKDIKYNLSDLWEIFYFNFSRSAFLHVLTVGGVFGFISLITLFFTTFREVKNRKEFFLSLFVFFIFLFFPPSIISWALLFIALVEVVKENELKELNLEFSTMTPIYVTVIITSLFLIGKIAFIAGQVYAAEYYFKKALDSFAKNDANKIYENHRKAIQLLPYVERFRISFSKVNLLLANNLTQQLLAEQKKEKPDKNKIKTLKQSITQAIQVAINEAKAAVALNPQRASNWANLATIYRNIVTLAKNADVWTISAYQRAIVLDPQNPIYRLNLGGVYFSLKNYQQALRLFEQAVAVKPNWANAHYNLAWAAYNTKDYQRAVVEMQNVLNLLDPKKAKADYEKAKKDLEEFKKKLKETNKATNSATTPTPTPSQLKLPTPIPTIKEKIQLPKEASPEAR